MAHQIWFEGNDFSWPLIRPVCFAMRMRSLQRARRRRRRMRSLCCTREVLVANAAIRIPSRSSDRGSTPGGLPPCGRLHASPPSQTRRPIRPVNRATRAPRLISWSASSAGSHTSSEVRLSRSEDLEQGYAHGVGRAAGTRPRGPRGRHRRSPASTCRGWSPIPGQACRRWRSSDPRRCRNLVVKTLVVPCTARVSPPRAPSFPAPVLGPCWRTPCVLRTEGRSARPRPRCPRPPAQRRAD